MSEFKWNPHPKQLEFLNDDREIVLYGGGLPTQHYEWLKELVNRSWDMSRIIEWLFKPKIILFIFPTYRQLRNWIDENKDEIIVHYGTINITTNKITFENGAIIWLGHAERLEDLDKYRGLEYDVVIGGDEQLRVRDITHRL